MPQIMFIKVDHNSAHYNTSETYRIRSSLETKEGLLDALSMVKYNCHFDNNDIQGAKQIILKDAENFIQNERQLHWSWCDKKQERTLMFATV